MLIATLDYIYIVEFRSRAQSTIWLAITFMCLCFAPFAFHFTVHYSIILPSLLLSLIPHSHTYRCSLITLITASISCDCTSIAIFAVGPPGNRCCSYLHRLAEFTLNVCLSCFVRMLCDCLLSRNLNLHAHLSSRDSNAEVYKSLTRLMCRLQIISSWFSDPLRRNCLTPQLILM